MTVRLPRRACASLARRSEKRRAEPASRDLIEHGADGQGSLLLARQVVTGRGHGGPTAPTSRHKRGGRLAGALTR